MRWALSKVSQPNNNSIRVRGIKGLRGRGRRSVEEEIIRRWRSVKEKIIRFGRCRFEMSFGVIKVGFLECCWVSKEIKAYCSAWKIHFTITSKEKLKERRDKASSKTCCRRGTWNSIPLNTNRRIKGVNSRASCFWNSISTSTRWISAFRCSTQEKEINVPWIWWWS